MIDRFVAVVCGGRAQHALGPSLGRVLRKEALGALRDADGVGDERVPLSQFESTARGGSTDVGH